MQLKTFQYIGGQLGAKKTGWSIDQFPALDSENTLVLIFAASEFINNPSPIEELAKFYSQSKIVGCSSAGEISGPYVSDNTISVAVLKFEKTPIKIAYMKVNSSNDSYLTGKKIAEILDQDTLRGIFI